MAAAFRNILQRAAGKIVDSVNATVSTETSAAALSGDAASCSSLLSALTSCVESLFNAQLLPLLYTLLTLNLVLLVLVVIMIILLFFASQMWSPKSLRCRGKHVVVTGGSSGIGLEAAREYLKLGANVTIVARNEQKLKVAKEDLLKSLPSNESKEGRVMYVAVDCASSQETVDRALELAMQTFGDVAVLINCAGTSIARPFDEYPLLISSAASDSHAASAASVELRDTNTAGSDYLLGIFGARSSSGNSSNRSSASIRANDDFERMLRVNVLGSVYPTRAVLASMKRRKEGRIVFVSSQVAQAAIHGYTAYAASKWALRGLAEALQMEVKPFGIYVSVCYPPDTDTPGYQEEMQTKPLLTKKISESGSVFIPEDVAKDLVHYSNLGYFGISTGLDGWLLKQVHPGMSPVNSFWEAAQQVLFCAPLRVVAMVYIVIWDKLVHAEAKKHMETGNGSAEHEKSE